MSSALRKCISFGPAGTINPGPGNTQYVAYENTPGSYANLIFLLDGNTRWVKIWVHLRSLWPTQSSVNTTLRDQLDYQIAVAKLYGFGVVLTIEQNFPLWINEGVHQTDIPLNTDLTGPWCSMFSALASRYSAANPSRPYGGYSYVDVFEYCNEPNQNWTTNANGNTDLEGTVALLFKRAKQIVVGLGNAPIVGGPAISDLATDFLAGNRNYFDFTQAVLTRLAGNGFYSVAPNSVCLWTHHNYTDVTYDQGAGSAAPDRSSYMTGQPQFDRFHLRSAWARALLVNQWKGWPSGNAADPRMFLTEGGAQAQVVIPRWMITAPQFPALQSDLVARNLIRLSDDTAAGGAGIDMMTNYLQITAPSYDTGMFEVPPALAARPLYTNTWKPYPGRL